jgi:hypothetical protein
MCESKRVGEPHEFVGLSGGAASALGQSGEGFLSIFMHPREAPPFGPPPASGEPLREANGAEVEIVRDTEIGQFDLYFCSTSCLRHFLNACVDELGRKLIEAAG